MMYYCMIGDSIKVLPLHESSERSYFVLAIELKHLVFGGKFNVFKVFGSAKFVSRSKTCNFFNGLKIKENLPSTSNKLECENKVYAFACKVFC